MRGPSITSGVSWDPFGFPLMGLTPLSDEELLELARTTRGCAYAPYSGFNVGAAVLSGTGIVATGVNIENASYGLTVCAERVAIFNLVASGNRRIERLAVSTGATGQSNAQKMPCGACLQVMSEFMTGTAVVLVDGVGLFSLSELIPHPFKL